MPRPFIMTVFLWAWSQRRSGALGRALIFLWYRDMWHRLTLFVYLVGVITAPAFGQATSEQKLRQEIETVFTEWLAAFNKGDGKAAAAFFAPDAPAINAGGVVRGESQDYINRIELQHRRNTNVVATIERVQAIGDSAAYATGPYTATFGSGNQSQEQGNWLQVYQRRGDAWKISASIFSRVGGVKKAPR
jgi:uncharacterized protein (TIGR02246 family)